MWFISRSPEGGCFWAIKSLHPFPTGALALQTKCYHTIEGCIIFCISVIVVCWLLVRGGSAFCFKMHHLFISWRLNLRSMMVSFSKEKVFSACAVAVRVAPVVTTVAEHIYIYKITAVT